MGATPTIFRPSGSPGSAGAGFGNVTGPGSAVDGQAAVFDGASGTQIRAATQTGVAKLASGVLGAGTVGTSEIADAAVSAAKIDPALLASLQDTVEAADFVSETEVVFSHGIGSEDVQVQVYDDGSPRKEILPAEIEITDQNTVTVRFDVATSGRIVVR